MSNDGAFFFVCGLCLIAFFGWWKSLEEHEKDLDEDIAFLLQIQKQLEEARRSREDIDDAS